MMPWQVYFQRIYLFVINRVFIYLGSACVKLMSSVGESRGQIGKDMGG